MNNNKIKVLIYGATGRMGKSNAISIDNSNEVELSGAVELMGNPNIGKDIGELCGIGRKNIKITDNLEPIINDCNVIVDFSSPKATIEALKINEKYKKAYIIGTTGLTEEQEKFIKDVSEKFPIVYAPNFSIGVNVMFKLIELASQLLNAELGYDLELIESHHKHKKDSPSGTAKKLLEIASTNSKRDIKDTIYGRKGIIGERDIKEIGMSVIRAGDIVGEHTVLYATDGERLEITHKAHSREAFSKGVVTSAIFIHNKDKGLYSMRDILGL